MTGNPDDCAQIAESGLKPPFESSLFTIGDEIITYYILQR